MEPIRQGINSYSSCRRFHFSRISWSRKKGHDGFAEYLVMVHKALGEYQYHIREMVSEHKRVFARMQFSEIHRGKLMGYVATGKRVHWEGTALFHFSGGLIIRLWVLVRMFHQVAYKTN